MPQLVLGVIIILLGENPTRSEEKTLGCHPGKLFSSKLFLGDVGRRFFSGLVLRFIKSSKGEIVAYILLRGLSRVARRRAL